MQPHEHIGPVLIVDDDQFVRVRLRALLESAGYIVFTAADGAVALALLRKLSFVPRLVILDVAMPIMDGWQFLESFRSEPEWRATAVVLYSSDVTGLPRGVHKLSRDAPDAKILELARRTCRRELS